MGAHVLNSFSKIPPDRVRGGGGVRGGGSRTGGRSGTGLLYIRVGFSQNSYGMILSSWILLDICFTSSLCNNKEIIENICDCTSDETLMVYTNGGSKTFT